jgi:hypothetical protein
MAQAAQFPDAHQNRKDSQQAQIRPWDHEGEKGPSGAYEKQHRQPRKLTGNNVAGAEPAVGKEPDQYDEIIDIGRGK